MKTVYHIQNKHNEKINHRNKKTKKELVLSFSTPIYTEPKSSHSSSFNSYSLPSATICVYTIMPGCYCIYDGPRIIY